MSEQMENVVTTLPDGLGSAFNETAAGNDAYAAFAQADGSPTDVVPEPTAAPKLYSLVDLTYVELVKIGEALLIAKQLIRSRETINFAINSGLTDEQGAGGLLNTQPGEADDEVMIDLTDDSTYTAAQVQLRILIGKVAAAG